MMPGPEKDPDSCVGKVYLEAATGAPDSQDICMEGYEVVIKRRDGLPMSEMELCSVVTNLPRVTVSD